MKMEKYLRQKVGKGRKGRERYDYESGMGIHLVPTPGHNDDKSVVTFGLKTGTSVRTGTKFPSDLDSKETSPRALPSFVDGKPNHHDGGRGRDHHLHDAPTSTPKGLSDQERVTQYSWSRRRPPVVIVYPFPVDGLSGESSVATGLTRGEDPGGGREQGFNLQVWGGRRVGTRSCREHGVVPEFLASYSLSKGPLPTSPVERRKIEDSFRKTGEGTPSEATRIDKASSSHD